MQVIIFVVLVAAICGVINIYFKNLRLWNGGRCAENGLLWDVVEYQDGSLYLFAGNVGRKVNGVLVPGVIARSVERVL